MKKLLLIILFIFVIPFVVDADQNNLLYDIIKNSTSSGYAKEYSGNHIDKLDGTGSEKIYYWYGADDEKVTLADAKRNIIFGGFCWQTLRTTDSGGVKILYNGIPENNKCLTGRPDATYTEGIGSTSLLRVDKSYYGTNYTYDEETGKYKLSGDLTFVTLNDEIGDSYVGKYTFLNTDPEYLATYAPYQVVNYLGNGYFAYRFFDVNYTTSYDSIGGSVYHSTASRDGLGGAGYMFDKSYKGIYFYFDKENYGTYDQEGTVLDESGINLIENSGPHNYTFDSSSSYWKSEKNSDRPASYFKFKVKTSGNYLLKFDSSNPAKVYVNDTRVDKITYGGKGTVILNNLNTDDIITIETEWHCSTCYYNFSLKYGTGEITDTRSVFGNDVTYSNGVYTLVNTMKSDGTNSINGYHYYCNHSDTTCEEVRYIYYDSNYSDYHSLDAYILKNGQKIDDIVNEQLYGDGVNRLDSPIKYVVDSWYEKNLLNYQNNLEDVVFCNNRTIKNNPLQKDNPMGSISFTMSTSYYSNNPEFSENQTAYNSNLDCVNVTDRFSTKNSKAKLKYPVAILTLPEVFLINNGENIYSRQNALIQPSSSSSGFIGTMTPAYQGSRWVIYSRGYLSNSSNGNGSIVRPVVSLKKGTKYIGGTGTMEDPFIIPNVFNISTDNNVLSGIVNSDISFDDVAETTNVVFTVNPRRGFELDRVLVTDIDGNEIDLTNTDNSYSFTMPSKNVIIKTYYKINVPNTIKNISFGIISLILIFISIGIIKLYINIKEE